MIGSRRRVAVFSGNRAEYGLLVPILRAIAADARVEEFLIVSGAHLKDDFGKTVGEIEADGFVVHARVAIGARDDSLVATAQAIGSGIAGLTRVLADLRPDFLVVYGDRSEAFAAVIAGTQMGIATVHIEGGDYTEGGALDDSVRHAMTKLSHLHCTTNEMAAQRVRNLGEEPWRVHNVGYTALDLIAAGDYAAPDAVYQRYGLDPHRPILLFTQHSLATEFEQAADQVRPSLAALEEAHRYWNCQVVVTYPNDDAGGRRIATAIEDFAQRSRSFAQVHHSLGRFNYHGVLNVAAACVGNSSSGIKDTPAFHCPTVNIGTRQQGRLRAQNVIDAGYDRFEILSAIDRCLHDRVFRDAVRNCGNPYGAGNAGPRIAEVIATVPFNAALIQKKLTY